MRFVAVGAAVMAVMASTSAQAADPIGLWTTEGAKAQVRIVNCNGGLCGSIVTLSDPNDPTTGRPKTDKLNEDASKRGRPVIGVQIVLGMKPNGANKWEGRVYNVEDGKTYSGNITLPSANTLRIQGCALGGLVCRSQTWTRGN